MFDFQNAQYPNSTYQKLLLLNQQAGCYPPSDRCVLPNSCVAQVEEVHRPDVAFFNHLQQGVQVHPRFEGGLALAAYLI